MKVKPEETPTPETPSTQVTDTPKTGDDTHMLIWILLAIAGMAGSVSAVWIAKKRKIKVNGGAIYGQQSHRCPFE